MFFIACDTCSDRVAKLFRNGFVGYCANIARYVAECGLAQVSVKIEIPRRVSQLLRGVRSPLRRYRAIWGTATIVSQCRVMWGHQVSRPRHAPKCHFGLGPDKAFPRLCLPKCFQTRPISVRKFFGNLRMTSLLLENFRSSDLICFVFRHFTNHIGGENRF